MTDTTTITIPINRVPVRLLECTGDASAVLVSITLEAVPGAGIRLEEALIERNGEVLCVARGDVDVDDFLLLGFLAPVEPACGVRGCPDH